MTEVVIRRLSLMVLTMFIVSLAIFFISEVVPVDVARNILGQFALPETIQAFKDAYGLSCPPAARYVTWLIGDGWVPPARTVLGEAALPKGCYIPKMQRTGILRGDMGVTLSQGVPLGPMMFRRLKNSAIIAVTAMIFIFPLALVLGLLGGLREGSWYDRTITMASLITTSTPSFAMGVLLVVIFSIKLRWLPGIAALTTEGNVLQSPLKLVLPVAVLFFADFGYVARMTRASMVEVMSTPYIRTAVLKGLPYRMVIFKHAMKNALLAPITVVVMRVGFMLGGTMIVESMFGYPGIGTLLLLGTQNKDVAIIEAGSMLMCLIAASTQITADFAYMYLNPRIRYK